MTEIAPAGARRSRPLIGASVEKLVRVCAIIFPYVLVGLFLRFVMARLFFLSGQAKIEGPRVPVHLNFPNTDFTLIDFSIILPREIMAATFQRFETQHANLPLPPEVAAYLVSYGEFVLPICLVLGFGTRFAALALAFMTAGLALYVAPALWWPTYVYWLAILLTLVSLGAGTISIDAALRALYRREAEVEVS
jgi:putative oxidoreductase